VTPQPLEQIVDPDWARALGDVEPTIRRLGDFLRGENAAERGFLPAGPHVLRAFTYPMSQVKVLIVGQDPYPTPGHAMGLAFSVPAQVHPLPPSLANVFSELTSDLGVPPPTRGDLRPWCDRGVMLLNRVLTVRPAAPASHRGKGWEQVTERAIDALAERGGPLVAILWGNDARAAGRRLGDVPRVESAHPSPLSAHRGFFGSRPFSRANALLQTQGDSGIDWALP
jgi:uracil-DNA glycosylase